MMQIYSDLEQFETIVLYQDKFPNWYKIFCEHSKLFINMSDDEYNLAKVTNPIIEEFIKINAGREPIPLKYQFKSLKDDFSIVADTPRAVYLLDITKEKANQLQKEYGVIIQGIDGIDDGVLRNNHFRSLKANMVLNPKSSNGWDQLVNVNIPPINAIVITDNYLFANEDGIRGRNNIVKFIETILPDELAIDFNILLIANEHTNMNESLCNNLLKDIVDAIRKFNKPYKIIFELVLAESIHNRIAVSNYFTITTEKGFAVFKSGDLSKVHENTQIRVESVFHRINKNEGDTVYANAELLLKEIKTICKSVSQYILKRPNDKNYRILGDCKADKSIRNRLINDVWNEKNNNAQPLHS
ncbi:MAG: hypothetical protein IPM69_00185 [Ignavibacteria bacterium]|nr:hypothetical protein [Ignavibacteria bacterium]